MKKIKRLFLLPITILALFTFSTHIFAEVLQEITVKESDTLWSIANFYLKDPKRWPDILKHNKLPNSDPNVVLPGMKLMVPVVLIKEHLRAAHLVYVLNDVKYRRQKAAEWNPAQKDMELFNDDGLRTMQQSVAQVKFPSGELLKLEENSLIILRPEKSREEIDLLSGGVRSSKTRILSIDTIIDPRIEPRGPNPDFKTRIKEDKTTLVEVYDGIVDITAQGRTVTLTKGFGTSVKFRQPPSLPQVLPPQPQLAVSDKPEENSSVKNKITSSTIELTVKRPESQSRTDEGKTKMISKIVNKYHIQVSTTPAFSSLALDKISQLSDKININFRELQIEDGNYYYRVAFVDELGFEGQFSTPSQFTLDTKGPELEIYPQSDVPEKEGFVHIEGKTEPGVILKINDKTIPVNDNGRFLTAIIPRKGENKYMLTAQDAAGNETVKELTIDGKIAIKLSEEKKPIVKMKKKEFSFATLSIASLTLVVITGVLVLIAM